MWIVAAQLRCAIELMPPTEAENQRPAENRPGVVLALEYQDALTGAPLTPSEAAALAPLWVSPDGAVLPAERVPEGDDGPVLVRRVGLPAQGSFTVRVDGVGSSRYFGCSRELPAPGAPLRRLRVMLVPRARDVALSVDVRRESASRQLPAEGVEAIELRPNAAGEREVEVHRGTCSGERPERGSHWCVRSLSPEPGRVTLSARVPGFGIHTVTVQTDAPERSVPLTLRVRGHHVPRLTLRALGAYGLVRGDGLGGVFGIEVLPASGDTGSTCALGDTCVRAAFRAGGGALPYARPTELVGPDGSADPDASTSGTLGFLELGGGVAVLPAATGDRLRLGAGLTAVWASRGEELDPGPGGLRLSAASTVFGLGGDVTAAWRFAGPLSAVVALRGMYFPAIGSRGRQFSYLGDAGASRETASLVHLSAALGLGVEL